MSEKQRQDLQLDKNAPVYKGLPTSGDKRPSNKNESSADDETSMQQTDHTFMTTEDDQSIITKAAKGANKLLFLIKKRILWLPVLIIGVIILLGTVSYLHGQNHKDPISIPVPVPDPDPKTTSNPESEENGPNTDILRSYANPLLVSEFENPTSFENIINPSIYRQDYVPQLQILCYLYSKTHLNFIIRDAKKKRFELPHEFPFPYPKNTTFTELEESDFILDVQHSPFNIIIKRKSTNESIFTLTDRLIYTNLYIEISFYTAATKPIYGFGERIGPLQYHEGTYSLFIMDRVGEPDPGRPGFNAQGHHSMYLKQEKSGLYHVGFLKNTNAQEVVISPESKITWKMIGGVIDFSFFLGKTAEEAVENYHSYIGGWSLPAFWHLGYHQSKWWGYHDINELETVLSEFDEHGLPFDVLWSDIDIFNNSINWNYNEKKFPPKQMQALFEKYKKHWVPVVQAYVPLQKEAPCWTYPNLESLAMIDGLTYNKKGVKPQPALGYAFSGDIFFIDFLDPKTEDFWHYMLDYLDKKMNLSGVWLDANEITNLALWWPEPKERHYQHAKERKYYTLPFYPGGTNFYDMKVVDFDAVHYGGVDEYNVRSLNALHQSQYTFTYLKKQKEIFFPFVLSRGTMFGSGQFAATWIPDIDAKWIAMRDTLGSIMSFSLFGIPMVGADICGLGGTDFRTPPELCARWHQLSVFYIFMRNHHQPENYPENGQEPYRYTGVYFKAIADSLKLRYSLLKHIYTLFFLKEGKLTRTGTIIRPLFFEFNDTTFPPYGHRLFEEQFMVGDSIMAAPILYESDTTLMTYFPQSRWFDLRNGAEVKARGKLHMVEATLDELVPHFLRGGRLIFKQFDIKGIRSSDDLDNTFTLVAGLNDFNVSSEGHQSSQAYGHILDVSSYDERSIYVNCALQNCLMIVNISCDIDNQSKEITVSLQSQSSSSEEESSRENPVEIQSIELLGIPKEYIPTTSAKITIVNGESADASAYTLLLDLSNDKIIINITEKFILSSKSAYSFSINHK